MSRAKPTIYLAVFLVDRCYGGAEEGGWYFDAGERIERCGTFFNQDSALQARDRLQDLLDRTDNEGRRPLDSVLSDGRYQACIDFADVPYFPHIKPQYE